MKNIVTIAAACVTMLFIFPSIYAFEVSISGSSLFTIGEDQQIIIYVKNTGDDQDSYTISCTKEATYQTEDASHLIDLRPQTSSIDFVNPGATGDTFVTVTLLGQITEGRIRCNAVSIKTSEEAWATPLEIAAGYPLSLPEFGLFGFIELMILASAISVVSYALRFS